jgi:LysM repeat protein
VDTNFIHDKKFQIALAIVGGVGALALISKSKSPSVQGTIEGASNGQASRTVYIPTSQYDIHTNYGTETSTVTTGNTVSSPVTPAPAKTPAPSVTPAPTKAPATTTSSYTIKKGDTLTSIAKKYNTSVDALAKANGISNPNKITAGKSIKIPVVTNATSKTPAVKTTDYVVKKGDNLTNIASHFHSSVSAISKLNGLSDPNKIYVGEHLKIQIG